MVKSVIKEILIMLLLCIAIVLIFGLLFYDYIPTNKMIPVTLPTEIEMLRFNSFLQKFRTYNPASTTFTINPNKCRHCIYCNLCEKTDIDNVYT